MLLLNFLDLSINKCLDVKSINTSWSKLNHTVTSSTWGVDKEEMALSAPSQSLPSVQISWTAELQGKPIRLLWLSMVFGGDEATFLRVEEIVGWFLFLVSPPPQNTLEQAYAWMDSYRNIIQKCLPVFRMTLLLFLTLVSQYGIPHCVGWPAVGSKHGLLSFTSPCYSLGTGAFTLSKSAQITVSVENWA